MPKRDKFSDLLKQGWSLHRRLKDGIIILCNDDGNLEIWAKNDHHASYGIIFEGHDYEFCSSNIDQITKLCKSAVS